MPSLRRMIPPCCVEQHACDVLLAKLIYSAPSGANRNEKYRSESAVERAGMVQSLANRACCSGVGVHGGGRLRSIAPTCLLCLGRLRSIEVSTSASAIWRAFLLRAAACRRDDATGAPSF